MKTLFKNYNSLRHFYLFILILYSCSRPSDEPLYGGTDVYYRLTEEQLKQTPYFTNPDFDTVTFISNNNDTLIFKKNYTDTSWYSVRPYFNANYYELYQNITNHYQTIKGTGNFSVTNSLRESNQFFQTLTVRFNSYDFLLHPDWFIKTQGYPFYQESYSINGKTYFDVITLFNLQDTSVANLKINNQFGALELSEKKLNQNIWKFLN